MCPALGACGGPPDQNGFSLPPIGVVPNDPNNMIRSQQWIVAPGHPSCIEDLYLPAREGRLAGANVPVAGMPAPEPALFDWCVLLVTGSGTGTECDPAVPGICRVPPRFYYESGPIGRASVQYDATGHFSAGLTRTGTYTLTFPAVCMRAFGAMDPANPTPDNNICKMLEVPVGATGLGAGAEFNTTCTPNTEAGRAQDAQEHPGLPPVDGPLDPQGCFCRFDLTETGGPSGDYSILPDQVTIQHIPGSTFPQLATFCQQGDNLQLTGADGAYLFDVAGLRTLDLSRACKVDKDCVSGHCVMQGMGSSVQGLCGN
jgi:hypothetical protein